MTRPAKLFLTCWVILTLHFATDIVREHYLAFSLAEDYSFRVDRYLGLHVDIFETPGHGAHIGNNPGASMLGAIPYWLARPVIDPVVSAINARRAERSEPPTAIYDDPRPRRVEFYREVRARGLDIQFGLAAFVMQTLIMALSSALAAVLVYRVLRGVGLPARSALLYGFLYALGTPVFFRSAFLNQNLLIAHFVLAAVVVLWRPGGRPAWSDRRVWSVAGLLGGLSVLFDYSGLVVLAWVGLHAVATAWTAGGFRRARQAALWSSLGAVAPIALLLFYQWRSFGSPWFPGQHYMPEVEWIDIGYQGVGLPEWGLFRMLLFDTRFGLFVACPLLALGLVGVVQAARGRTFLPRREALSLFGFTLAMVIFFSAVQYTQLQWVTGVRYIVPVIPALFLLTVVTLERLPRNVRFLVVVLAFAESWALSMARAVEIPDSLAQVFLGGFQLPWMNVLSKMAPQYFPFLAEHASPLPIFALTGLLLYGVWTSPERSNAG